MVGAEADGFEQFDDAVRRTRAGVCASPWMISASPTIAPTVMRGLSEAYGSWKMICMSRAQRAQLGGRAAP